MDLSVVLIIIIIIVLSIILAAIGAYFWLFPFLPTRYL